jgi:hypothetical protein
MKSGDQCTVNGRGDLMMEKSTYGPFIGKPCTIVKQTKSGLYNVWLNADPRKRVSVARDNISLMEPFNEEHKVA